MMYDKENAKEDNDDYDHDDEWVGVIYLEPQLITTIIIITIIILLIIINIIIIIMYISTATYP